MKRTTIFFAAVFFTTAGLSMPASNAAPQIVVTPNPCLPGYRLTVQISIRTYGSPWTLISQYNKGFHTQEALTAFVTAYNSGNTTTQMSASILCTQAPGGPQP